VLALERVYKINSKRPFRADIPSPPQNPAPVETSNTFEQKNVGQTP